jgi:Uma2 family endonuclease
MKKWIQGAAELTIEVVSPSDSGRELLEKAVQYLNAGGQVVWIVYPDEREVRVFDATGAIRILKQDDTIDAPQILPGFAAPVSAFPQI